MGLRQIIYERCTTHAGTAALVGDRVYPERLPDDVTYPAIRFLAPISNNSAQYRSHDGAGGRTVSRAQLDGYAETGTEAEALADQLVAAWDGYSDGCDVGYAFKANRRQTRADALDVFRAIVDVMIEHSES